MKLIVFSKKTASTHREPGQPTVNFNHAGAISFSPGAVDLLELKEGEKLSVVQDEDSPDDWYVFRDKEDGFPLRQYKNSKALAFNSSVIANRLIKHLRANAAGVTIPISDAAEKVGKISYYPIITLKATWNEIKKEADDEQKAE